MKRVLIFVSLIFLMAVPALSQNTPYQITTCEELYQIENDPTGNYILMNDINCAETINWDEGRGFKPIDYFLGSFDGQNHIIRGLYINRPDIMRIGLFDRTNQQAEIKNVGLVNVKIFGKDVVGSLVGSAQGYSTISKCFVSAGIVKGVNAVGGLIGSMGIRVVVEDSYTNVKVISEAQGGGLIGYSDGGEIISCYASGNVFGNDHIGALVGHDERGNDSYLNSFTVGRVFCKPNTSKNCFGYIVGYSFEYPTIENSFWLDYPNDCADKCVGNHEHECEGDIQNNICYFMHSANAPMTSWDFVNTWSICEGATLPFLKWQQIKCRPFPKRCP